MVLLNVFAFKVQASTELHSYKQQQQRQLQHTFQSNRGERQRWNLGWTTPSTLWYAPLHNTQSNKAEVSS